MADLLLPAKPLPKLVSVIPLVFGGWQTPPTGGDESWLGFMGNRFSTKLQTPRLRPEPDGRLWAAAILDGLMEGKIVGCRFFQPGFRSFAMAAHGSSIVVDGSGQSGSILKLRGFSPGSAVHHQEFFTIVTADRRCLHRATAQGIVGADGKLSLAISPMLRIQPADGDACIFGAPMIEGKLTVDGEAYTHIPAFVDSLSFTITETR